MSDKFRSDASDQLAGKGLEAGAGDAAASLDVAHAVAHLQPEQIAEELQRLMTELQRRRAMLDTYYAAIVRLTRLIGSSGRDDLIEEAQQILGTLGAILQDRNRNQAAGQPPQEPTGETDENSS